MRHAVFPLIFAFASLPAIASVEWPLLYAFRAVEFTTAQVQHCNKRFPVEATERLRALELWRTKNESVANVIREFNTVRMRLEDKTFDLQNLDREFKDLETSALRQIDRTTCAGMAQWLQSEQSDVVRQIPSFMRPR